MCLSFEERESWQWANELSIPFKHVKRPLKTIHDGKCFMTIRIVNSNHNNILTFIVQAVVWSNFWCLLGASHPNFMDKESEAQRDYTTCQWSTGSNDSRHDQWDSGTSRLALEPITLHYKIWMIIQITTPE